MMTESTIELFVKTGTFLVTAWGVFRGFIKYLEKRDTTQANANATTIASVMERALVNETRHTSSENKIKDLSEEIALLGKSQAEIRTDYSALNKIMIEGFTHVNQRIDEVLKILANKPAITQRSKTI